MWLGQRCVNTLSPTNHCDWLMAKSLEERFWAKVNKNGPTQPHMDTPCWEWIGAKHNQGYGRVWLSETAATAPAHRIGWLLQTGKDPVYLRHRCDNACCVRAEHLVDGENYLEAHAVNIQEAYDRGRINRAKGSECSHAKLDEHIVKIIRRRAAAGDSQRKLGKDYGISHAAVGHIVRRKTWRHVQ